jgi:cell cycle arrest protein BUB3
LGLGCARARVRSFQTVRLYDARANEPVGVVLTHKGPVLDCCFHDDDSGFSASADHVVRR